MNAEASIDSIRRESFRDLFRVPQVVDFARWVILSSYTECTPGVEPQTAALLETAFAHLTGSCTDPRRFQESIEYLVKDVFRKPEPDFWLNKIYHHYKQTIKPLRRYSHLEPYLKGSRVLDLGCGDGLTSAELSRRGYRVSLTDVIDYRDEDVRDLPFRLMSDPTRIPYSNEGFDTVLIMAVLHHVLEEDLLPLLADLRKTGARLIVEEDCYVAPEDLLDVQERRAIDVQLERFLSLSVENQFRYLMFIDFFANAINQGNAEMEIPFNFRTVSGWKELFASCGFQLSQTLVLGFQKGNFNRSCHVWYVLD